MVRRKKLAEGVDETPSTWRSTIQGQVDDLDIVLKVVLRLNDPQQSAQSVLESIPQAVRMSCKYSLNLELYDEVLRRTEREVLGELSALKPEDLLDLPTVIKTLVAPSPNATPAESDAKRPRLLARLAGVRVVDSIYRSTSVDDVIVTDCDEFLNAELPADVPTTIRQLVLLCWAECKALQRAQMRRRPFPQRNWNECER